MSKYSLSHLTDGALLRDLVTLVSQDRATTAALLAHLAEFDARQLYLPAAYPSLFSYCVHELHLSEDAAYKRIQAARVARQFPAIFPMLADGRLHLAAVCRLAPYLTAANAEGLLSVAAGKRKAAIEELLAERFPRSELLPLVVALPGAALPATPQLAPGQVGSGVPGELQHAPGHVGSRVPDELQLAPGQVGSHTDLSAPGRIEPPAPRGQVKPIAPARYALQLTIGKRTHEKLEYARALLGHTIPSGEIAEVIDRALDALIRQLEQRKLAATSRPRPQGGVASSRRRTSANPRHIPAEVRRAVWARDGGQCTYVSASGKRCEARTRLEFDHVEPVARGGRATAENLRLRCRAHNQYDAERTFGTGFMSRKRKERREAAEQARLAAAERSRAMAAAQAREAVAEVIPWLRSLGLRADEARWAAESCEARPGASLEQRVRMALSRFAQPRHGRAVRIPPARAVE